MRGRLLPLLHLVAAWCIAVATHAQAYRPMLVDGASWNLYQHIFVSHDYKHSVIGDSTVNGTTYKVLSYGDWPYGFNTWNQLWREDTATAQVFQLVNGTEYLLYDWSVQVGDTISVWGLSLAGGQDYELLVLDSVTQDVPNGVLTSVAGPRFLYFHVPGSPTVMVWSEGIGSLAGLEWPSTWWDINYDVSLTLCHADSSGVRNHEIPVYQADVDSCIGIEWTSVAERAGQTSFSCHPNPVQCSATFTVTIHEPHSASLPLEILDTRGLVVRQFLVQYGTNIIQLSGLNAGLYLVRLANASPWLQSAKLIVE
ncbi:MAG: T9SS type A sorting domain-containing protein [Flavobacteriales bacterium]|nr:MAG: T9SS type A sorting domain-containing protein [Flavobacteriales bacterium]